MLDATTKRKIDSARQILVGKVPNPTEQVEQITAALIYKFMDDMDKKAQELGGKAKFFTNGFAKYSWVKLMDRRLSGQERLDIYTQAIANIPKNELIPEIFRDIFEKMYLPFYDHETLNMFLKEIDGFSYDHSENLGDAYEYLLSMLGTQKKLGQLRTPRHIIDFIVEVVGPRKNETILDPACGTAGFLISAYKYILKHNSSNFKPEKEETKDKIKKGETAAETILKTKEEYGGDLLTPIEKKKIMNNIAGYDIAPIMKKLSLVNMYLHGFPNPRIYEYDSLTYEDRWNETFDVIMANPPFFSPKGGIRPHKKFSVRSNRAEVLFVDYILEHLNLKGRAGIIVPEGIVFKNENAYKQLRQMLLEDGLFAVVSLPPGVFNPYSEIRTSILFLDNQFAKRVDEILFLKIKNDGFDLGKQRRKIDKNDLPKALEILEAWKKGKKQKSGLTLWVRKDKIAERGDYNLTGERYKEIEVRKNQKWPEVELGEICEIFNGSRPKGGAISSGVLSIGGEHINSDGSFNLSKPRYIPEKFFKELRRGKLEKGDVLVVKDGATTGKMGYFDESVPFNVGAVNEHVFVLRADNKKIAPFYLFQFLKSKKGNIEILKHKTGAAQGGINLSIKKIKIPLPPLEVQKEIVEQIEVKQNAINHAKEIIKNLERERRYFGQEIRKLEDVEQVQLGDILDYEQPTKYIVKSANYKNEYKTPVLTAGQTFILGYTDEKEGIFPKEKLPVIIFDDFTTATKFVDFPFKVKSSAMKILSISDKNKADIKFVFLAMQDIKFNHSTHKRYWISEYSKIKIPLPPLEIQKQLVAEAEKEEEIIASNRRLINLMERKIGEVLETI